MLTRRGWLALGVTLAAMVLARPAPAQELDISGVWEGEITLPGTALPIEVLFEREGDGWGASMTIAVQGLIGRKLTGVSLDGRSIGFVLPGIPGDPTFTGEVEQDASRMGGAFTQGALNATWFLEPTGVRGEALAAELDEFAEWFEGARQAWDVPGASVCVVRGGEIIFSRGFGQRDREGGLEATEDTLFAIGSCSKAFTTMLLAQLVESGEITWDDRVQEHLPEFALEEPERASAMTIRDLVTHRSGLPRHDLAWYGNEGASRDELLAMMARHKATAGLRSVWQYNNLMFMVAGMVVERVTGESWESNVQSRILAPLGMDRSTMSIGALTADADHARAYFEVDDEVRLIDYRPITAVGPAGSINSSATEMGAWLIAQLGASGANGEQIIGDSGLTEMHKAQMIMSSADAGGLITSLGYGLGWMVDIYRGNLRVSHGGGIDGFSSLVTLIPGEQLGIVILTNSNSGLPGVAMQHVLDRMLGLEEQDWSAQALASMAKVKDLQAKSDEALEATRAGDAPPSRPLEAFSGRYEHPGYGVIEVELDGDTLVAHVNKMEAPLEHWHYDVFRFGDSDDRVLRHQLVQFVTAFDGTVRGVRWQVEPSVEAVVFERRSGVTLDAKALAGYVGTYRFEIGQEVTLEVRGERLVASIPGQPVFELTPVEADLFEIKGMSGFRVRFERGDGENVETAVFMQPNGVFRAEREGAVEAP